MTEEKNPFEFRRCTECLVKQAHGYLWCVAEPENPERVPVTIITMRALRWMLDQLEFSDAHKAEVVAQAAGAGLVEEMGGDVRSAELQLYRFFDNEAMREMFGDLSSRDGADQTTSR